jgi:hypothetical protein
MMTIQSRTELFLNLSALLTGFDTLELTATGLSSQYLNLLDSIVPAEILDSLLGLVANRDVLNLEVTAQIAERIFNDGAFAPVASSLILLWYQGVWNQLPDTWRTSYQEASQDYTHVVSSQAYLSGLQWLVAGAHPSGGKPQGFAAWANPV